MKILLSALACEPAKGSELEVGFRAMLAAASRHEVWVLTNSASIPAIRRAIQGLPCAERIHLEGIYFEVDDELYPQLTAPGFHLHYDRWQRKAAARAIELDRRIDFDVIHHVTLAAHWTRAGVAAVKKPLVWGPVGGGVEAPLAFIGELGWRGVLEEVGRVIARRLLARIGPARQLQRRAIVTFAQNEATVGRVNTRGRLSVLSNATVVDLAPLGVSGGRTQDVLLVGRLLHWKAPILALRAFRYVQTPGARLVFCGEGVERRRLERAARRWGIVDRVQFAGWMARDAMLSRLGTAGALVHPALHEEAGLCVAEALALGTPVVCLDHGGPPELLRQWPDTPSAAVPPGDPVSTARALAAALDRFLADPPPIRAHPRRALTSFEDELLAAYDTALAAGHVPDDARSMVWGFPAGKPQVFGDSLAALSEGVLVYGFGRRIPRLVQRGIAIQVRVPGLRRLVVDHSPRIDPVCGWTVWQAIVQRVREHHPQASGEWLHFRSQWPKQRSSLLGLGASGAPEFFLTVEPARNTPLEAPFAVPSFRVPACTASFRVDDWLVREHEPLPRFHRPTRWDPTRIRTVAADASRALAARIPRPPDAPLHWRPIHGDLVPWNLREDDQGRLWLLDWEDAGWGPPLADFVRFIVAYYSLGWSRPGRIAARVTRALEGESEDTVREVAEFWLRHRNFSPLADTRNWRRQKVRDASRSARELAAFRVLASRSGVELPDGSTIRGASAYEPTSKP